MLSAIRTEEFGQWLIENGADVKPVTNPYEVIRYKRPDFGTVIIYTNKAGRITANSTAQRHYRRFLANQPLATKNRPRGKSRLKKISALLDRDGSDCCLCGRFIVPGEETIEHWLPISLGGNNDFSNMALAHEDCNVAMDNLPIIEKIKLRDLVMRVVALMGSDEEFNITKFMGTGR